MNVADVFPDGASVFEFFERFPDELAAVRYIEAQRWPEGVACPRCSSHRLSRTKDCAVHNCLDCKRRFSIRKGTIFERSHIPLRKWLFAMYAFKSGRKGCSSVWLSKQLGITQKSAWFLLHRIREASREGRIELLRGVVEVDETYIGGKEKNKHKRNRTGARGRAGKQAVLGLLERGGRVRMFPVPNVGMNTLIKAVWANVEEGSSLYTDEFAPYVQVGFPYDHHAVHHRAGQYAEGTVTTNGIESVWAVLKRGYNGVYHYMSVKHLHRYCDEFAFRLNHQENVVDALVQGGIGRRLTYAQLIAG